jgi:uncharacterized protein (DUF2236 family)
MIVTRQAFEQRLEQVRSEAAGPVEGLFGPGSAAWRIICESVVFLGAGRAALLQLAHPYVAHAIAQHSDTRTNPVGRFNRTFLNVYAMVFGDLETAIASAQRVRGVHDRIHGPVDEDVGRFARGHRYHANDADALLWVYATLLETSVMAYEIGIAELSLAEKDAFYRDMRRAGWLFGIPDEIFPADWTAFKAYCARMFASDTLAVGGPAREIAGFLLAAPRPALGPLLRWYENLTAGLLPPRIREGYGLGWSRADELVYRSSLGALRRGWPRIPLRLRRVPEYVEAMHRLEGRPRPDRMGRGLWKLVLQSVKPRA